MDCLWAHWQDLELNSHSFMIFMRLQRETPQLDYIHNHCVSIPAKPKQTLQDCMLSQPCNCHSQCIRPSTLQWTTHTILYSGLLWHYAAKGAVTESREQSQDRFLPHLNCFTYVPELRFWITNWGILQENCWDFLKKKVALFLTTR